MVRGSNRGIILLLVCIVAIAANATVSKSRADCEEVIESLIKDVWHFPTHNKNERKIKTLLETTEQYNISSQEKREILQKLMEFDELPPYRLLKAYFLFLHSLKPRHKKEGIAQFDYLLTPEKTDSKIMKKFFRIYDRVRKRNNKKLDRLINKIQKENLHLSPDEAYQRAKTKLSKDLRHYEELSFVCRGTRQTPQTDIAEDHLKRFTKWIVIGSSFVGFTMANQEKWEGWNDWVWYSRFLYEVTFQLATSMIGIKNLAKPEYSLLHKTLFKYGWARTNGAADAWAYDYLFGASGKIGKSGISKSDIVEQIKNHPDRENRLAELQAYLNDPSFYTKYKQVFSENWQSLKEHMGFEKDLSLDDFDLSQISEKDLDNETVQELIFVAAMAEVYEETKGDWVDSGNTGMDRWLFQAGYGLAFLPRDMAVALGVRHILCMGQYNPQKAFATALALFLGNRFIGDPIYYWARDKAISQ